jgi:ferric-dicitrate binding protein FerR (iron transport regulator)
MTGETASLSADGAGYWLARLGSSDELSETEMCEWEQWITVPMHAAEYDECLMIGNELRKLPRPTLPSARELGGIPPS